MKDAMNRLAQFLGRRRRWVVAVWVLIVLLALPFAAKQTEHLTGGGFDVPGSQSKAVGDALQSEFGAKADGIAVLLEAEPGATAAQRQAAIGRVRRQVAQLEGVTLPAAGVRAARRGLRAEG